MSFDHLTALKHTNTKQRVIFHREICVLKQICVQNENIWVFPLFSVYLRGKNKLCIWNWVKCKKTQIKIKRKNFANTQFNKQPKIECKSTWNDINNSFPKCHIFSSKTGYSARNKNNHQIPKLYIQINVISEAERFLWILRYNNKLVWALLSTFWTAWGWVHFWVKS